jgi:hypothetical protein
VAILCGELNWHSIVEEEADEESERSGDHHRILYLTLFIAIFYEAPHEPIW